MLKYDQIEEGQRKAAGFDGMLPNWNIILKLFSKLLFRVDTLKKHLEISFCREKESAPVTNS